MFERFRKPKVTPEQQSTAESLREADPTTYSILPPKEKLRSAGREKTKGNQIVSDGSSRFFEVTREPEQQQAIARMAKGILNVSDVVRVADEKNTTHHYSHEMQLERIQRETPAQEILADQFILDAVLSSTDRSYSDSKSNNVRSENGRAAHFDFQGGPIIARDSVDVWVTKLEKLDTVGKGVARGKLLALRERFEGEEGFRFLNAIVTASGRTAWRLFAPHDREYTVNDLQKNLLLRIDNALTSLSEVADTVDLPQV